MLVIRRFAFILCVQLAASACADVEGHPRLSGADENPGGQPAAASGDSDTAARFSADIAGRFPGADILDEAEFAGTIVGRGFRYGLPSGLIIHRPAEFFYEDGRYSVGHQAISTGRYSFEGGVVSIDCAYCPETFLGLGRKRIVFRHEGRILMANRDEAGDAIELIPVP